MFLKRFLSDEIFLGLILASVIPAGRAAVFLVSIYGGKPVVTLVISGPMPLISPQLIPITGLLSFILLIYAN